MGVTYDEMKESKDCDSFRSDFVPGAMVEREIEGMWFLAEITHSYQRGTEFTLRYTDDDNVEEGVTIDEVRISRNIESVLGSPKAEKKSVLPKPLLGLIEDDAVKRHDHEAKVTIHQDNESDSSIIINGTEKSLAVGGGLRALRQLKNIKKRDHK